MSRIRRNWTAKEDTLLRDLVNKELKQSRPILWRELAKHIPGRSNKDCRKRWWNSLADGTLKGPWSQEEDKRLTEAVWEHGTNWNQVARVVGSRCADQCSSHWSQVLNPDINYCDWTTQEDEQLLHAVLSYGTNWTTIAASHTPQRTTLALKNRYSKLRLRHQNTSICGGSSSARAPASPSTEVVNKTKTKKNIQVERFNVNRDTEDDEGNEEGDEEGDEDDEDEEDMDYGHSTRSHNASKSSLGSNELAKTPDMWEGYTVDLASKMQASQGTPKVCGEPWMDSIMEQTMYGNTELCPHEGFLSTTQDRTGVDVNIQFARHDEDAMNLDPGKFQGTLYHESEVSHAQNPLSGDFITSVATFPLSPTGRRDTNSPVGEASISTRTPAGVLHQVSINLACTTEQLSNIMTWLPSTGSAINVKIDTQ